MHALYVFNGRRMYLMGNMHILYIHLQVNLFERTHVFCTLVLFDIWWNLFERCHAFYIYLMGDEFIW